MRTIKFRCWFANKMWHSIPAIRFVESGIKQIDLNHDTGDFSACPDTWTGNDDYELMQFTGLLDKNGKEIYEGDIVKALTLQKEKQREITFQIQWGWWGFIGDDISVVPPHHAEWLVDLTRDVELKTFEVIGNIYEDKHLLEGAKDE